MNDFIKNGILYNPDVDNYIEKDYFKQINIENGDFSDGLNHWATYYAADQSNENKRSKFAIETMNNPSLKVEVRSTPCRLYYIKNKEFVIFANLPWEYRLKNIWMGTPAGMKAKISFLHKGIGFSANINLLEKSGHAVVLTSNQINEQKNDFKKEEIAFLIPADGRAISLEFVVNNHGYNRVFYLDNVKLELNN